MSDDGDSEGGKTGFQETKEICAKEEDRIKAVRDELYIYKRIYKNES